jgi:hypothetical protein
MRKANWIRELTDGPPYSQTKTTDESDISKDENVVLDELDYKSAVICPRESSNETEKSAQVAIDIARR